MKNKILLLDVDFTILDLTKTKKYLIKKLKTLLDKKNTSIIETINILIDINTKENKIFNPYKFTNEIVDQYKINKKIIKNIIWSKSRFIESLYDDVLDFIKKIYKNLEIIIYSQGHIAYQKKKISGIKKYVKEQNIFIYKNKKLKLKNILNKYKNKKIFLIDDSPEIVNQAKKINKDIIGILMKRKNGKKYLRTDINLANYTVDNLKSAYKIIKTY